MAVDVELVKAIKVLKEQLAELEQRVLTQPTPKDGINGKDGRDGINGKDGIGIHNVYTDADSTLIIEYSNGEKCKVGKIAGVCGRDGVDGVSVTNATITNNHLYITLSDGRVIDAGEIGGGEVKTKLSEFIDDLGNSPVHTHSQYAESSSIPTKTSDLTNDSGFVTSADIPTKTSDLTNDSGFITDADLPTKTSDLQNDSGFIDKSVNNLDNYTLSSLFGNNAFNSTPIPDDNDLVHKTDNETINGVKTFTTRPKVKTPILPSAYQEVEYIESDVALLTDIEDVKPIVVHITGTSSSITGDYTFSELQSFIGVSTIEACYNGNHLRLTEHTNSLITFISTDIDTTTGSQTETIITVNSSNVWSYSSSIYIPLKKDKLLYDKTLGLQVTGTLNPTYVDSDGYLITTGSSGSWDAWNITGMDLSEFRFIRFVCFRDTDNTGGTWICDVPMHTPIQAVGSDLGFFVSSGQMSSFGDRNRWNVVQCGVKGDKTSISIGQVFSLYGTAATTVKSIKICAVYGVY